MYEFSGSPLHNSPGSLCIILRVVNESTSHLYMGLQLGCLWHSIGVAREFTGRVVYGTSPRLRMALQLGWV